MTLHQRISSRPRARMRYGLPPEPLRPFVSGYHHIDCDPGDAPFLEELFWPSWPNLRFVLSRETFPGWSAAIGDTGWTDAPDAAFWWPTRRAVPLRAGRGRLVGIGLLPLGFAHLCSGDAQPWADRLSPAADLIGPDADALLAALRATPDPDSCFRLFDAWLADRFAGVHIADDDFVFHQALVDPDLARVEDLCDRLSLSPRQAHRRALRLFGMPPKMVMRRTRLLRTLIGMRDDPRPWAERLDATYTDQAQFVRDCREFMREPPTRFFQRQGTLAAAALVERERVMGEPIQALHVPQIEQRHRAA